MRNLFKKILPPFIVNIYREIYIRSLIYKNKKFVNQDKQDIDIYDTELTAEKLSEWGKDTTWNEIQMFFASKTGKVLDLACGTGINILDIKKINPKIDIYGCDISQSLINICIKSGLDENKLICTNGINIKFEENYFDYSYSIGSLEHFTEDGLDEMISKLHFITKNHSIHMMPVSKKNVNEGWIKTYQTFHNNSVDWWVGKFKKKFSKVDVINSSWNDHISVGKWFVCYK
jgi:ubiquinone/menaquinone biosynthesis C-methylase UbiE